MKLLPVLLGLSLAANAAMIVVKRSDGTASRAAAGDRAGAGAAEGGEAARFVAPQGPATGDGKAIASALQAGDLERLRDELRAAGVEEDLVRSIVGARLWKHYEARHKALQPKPDPNRPWWKNDEDWQWGGLGQTKEQREQARALREEQKAEMERLLGKDPNATEANPWLARQYAFVAPEKREELQRLEQDYNELANELRRESRGFTLPSDQEKMKFLEEEKRRDLASVLTPEEMEAYELRQSRTAQNLRWRMTQMDATEEEFRAIFEVQKDFDERFNEYDQYGMRTRTMTQDDWKARNEAEKAMKEQLKATLGQERYAAYLRSQDHDFQQLRNATKRFELPPDTPNKIYALRDEVPQAAAKIADDAALSGEQKKEALKKLVEETRERVRGTLGAEAADAYFKNNGMPWLNQMEQGTIVTFNEDGVQSHRRIEQAAPRR